MSKPALIIVLVFVFLQSNGQNINVTVTGTGAATRIDRVTAINLTTGKSISLPGNESLVLTANTGIPPVAELGGMATVFPNPFSGRATLSVISQKPRRSYQHGQLLDVDGNGAAICLEFSFYIWRQLADPGLQQAECGVLCAVH